MGFNPTEPRDAKGRWSSGIIDSLEHQLRGKGHAPAKAHELAIEIGQNHGLIDKQGNLTAKGREREAMGHKERVKERAAKQLGKKPEEIGIKNNRPFVK